MYGGLAGRRVGGAVVVLRGDKGSVGDSEEVARVEVGDADDWKDLPPKGNELFRT